MKPNPVASNLLGQTLSRKEETTSATPYPLKFNAISNAQNENQVTIPQIKTEKTKNKTETTRSVYSYSTRGDGACFFRALLAHQQDDPSWLQAKPLSAVYDWINQTCPLFIQSIQEALRSLYSQDNYHHQTERIFSHFDCQGPGAIEHFLLWDDKWTPIT